MMRLPVTALFAALVVVAAGSVILNVYIKSDAPYVLNMTDIGYRQNKTFIFDHIPYRIEFRSNVYAWYVATVYFNGTVAITLEPYDYTYVVHDVYYTTVTNGTALRIKPVDVRDARIKIVVTRVWPP